MSKSVLFQTIQFSISTLYISTGPMHRTLSVDTTPDQSGSGNDGNEGEIRIPQGSSITETSSSDCLVSYPGHLLKESYLSTEKQLVYSTAPADRAIKRTFPYFATKSSWAHEDQNP